jgi:hypothetical protein
VYCTLHNLRGTLQVFTGNILVVCSGGCEPSFNFSTNQTSSDLPFRFGCKEKFTTVDQCKKHEKFCWLKLPYGSIWTCAYCGAEITSEILREVNSLVRAAVSTSNAPYQAATNGAYLSAPELIGLRSIACLNEDTHDLGYDSDGEMTPFLDAVENEQPFEEYQDNAAAPPQQSENIIRAMKVSELRNELRSRNKTVSNAKDVLIQRL